MMKFGPVRIVLKATGINRIESNVKFMKEEEMYELLKNIDFSTRSNNPEKQQLKNLFVKWLSKKYPDVNTTDTYFTDAIFIGNNPSLRLNIVSIMEDEDEGRMIYFSKLVNHFENKGYDSGIAHKKAKEYLARFDMLKEFLNEQ